MANIKISRKGIELAFIDVSAFSKVQDYNKFFAFFVIRNVSHLLAEVQAMDDIKKKSIPSVRVTEFEAKRNELIEKYCDKDKDGKSITTTQDLGFGRSQTVFNFSKTAEKFNKEFAKLTETYKVDIDAYDTSIKELETLMNEEIEIEVAKISFKHVPDSVNIKNIMSFFNETPEEIEALLQG